MLSIDNLAHPRIAFQGHSRSLELTWIDRLPMTSYQRSIVTMGLYLPFPRYCETTAENCEFFARLFNAPVEEVTLAIFLTALGKKTRVTELPGRGRSLMISLLISIQYSSVVDAWRSIAR